MPLTKQKITSVLTSFLLAFTIFYFAYHGISGQKGLLQMLKLQRQLDQTAMEYEEAAVIKNTWETKVKKLYEDSLDRDLLDEQARKVLGYSRKGEVVYIIPEKGKE